MNRRDRFKQQTQQTRVNAREDAEDRCNYHHTLIFLCAKSPHNMLMHLFIWHLVHGNENERAMRKRGDIGATENERERN